MTHFTFRQSRENEGLEILVTDRSAEISPVVLVQTFSEFQNEFPV